MEHRNEHPFLAASLRDSRQSGVHCSSASGADRCQLSKILNKKRRAHNRDDFPKDIGHQGDDTQFRGGGQSQARALELGNQNRGQGIIRKTAAHGQAVPKTPSNEQERGQGTEKQSTRPRSHGHQQQTRPNLPQSLLDLRVASYVQSHLKHQGIEDIKTDIPFSEALGQRYAIADETPKDKGTQGQKRALPRRAFPGILPSFGSRNRSHLPQPGRFAFFHGHLSERTGKETGINPLGQ